MGMEEDVDAVLIPRGVPVRHFMHACDVMGNAGGDGDVVRGVVPLLRPGLVASLGLEAAGGDDVNGLWDVGGELTFGEALEVLGDVVAYEGCPGGEVRALAEQARVGLEVSAPQGGEGVELFGVDIYVIEIGNGHPWGREPPKQRGAQISGVAIWGATDETEGVARGVGIEV